MEFAAHQLAEECLAFALETRRYIQSLPYLEDQTVGRKRMENRDFFNHRGRKKEETHRHQLCLRHLNHNNRLVNFFKRCHRVNKNSPNKKFMEMSLSSSGRMLKSYFSRQQRRSRSSLFDTSTSFCRRRSRSR